MTTEDLLNALSGTTPTEINPTPGFTPVARRKGPSLLDQYQPQTDTERELIGAARPLFGKATPEEHRRFRLALYATYEEQGFTKEDLWPFFPDITP